jgi:large subunit ribosomal protein L15
MMIHEITAKTGKYKNRVRVGRGEGSGLGKTSGRGTKGAHSRSGWAQKVGYIGGAVPLQRRLPKRGFTNAPFRREYAVVNVKTLDTHCRNGEDVTIESLAKAGLVRDASKPLKVLGEGELTKKLNITAEKFSGSAKSKIEAAGGTITVVPAPHWTRAQEPKAKK